VRLRAVDYRLLMIRGRNLFYWVPLMRVAAMYTPMTRTVAWPTWGNDDNGGQMAIYNEGRKNMLQTSVGDMGGASSKPITSTAIGWAVCPG